MHFRVICLQCLKLAYKYTVVFSPYLWYEVLRSVGLLAEVKDSSCPALFLCSVIMTQVFK